MGRTEQFAEVVFEVAQIEGAVVNAQITGHVGEQLTA